MIITDRSRPKRRRAAGIIAAALALLLLILLGFALRPERPPYRRLPEGAVYCSAEKARGGKLVNQGHEFGSASLRSKAQARTGRYSCYLPASEGTAYGFGYQLDNPAPGSAYKASVWRLQNTAQAGVLAVKVDGEAPHYQQENAAAENDGRGWEKLEIRFFIPYGKRTDKFSVYVYGGGNLEVFFDDLLIEQIPAPAGSFRPEVLELNVKKEAMQALRLKRGQALRAGILEASGNDWVEAELQGDSTGPMAVDIRLKGDWLDHLRGDKWSFRVKMRGAYAWRRMRSFSLHTPLARYYLHEWLLHQLWEKEDVLTTRYDFVELRLNGRSLGIYAYEEHFDKQAVEFRERREGPILKFSEDGMWKAIGRQLAHQGYVRPGAEHAPLDWQNAPVETFQQNSYEPGSSLERAARDGMALMEQYRRGTAPPEEAFDLLRLARYYAICDVLNAYHGIAWHNQRFYYNPVTGKLEPFGFDGYGDRPEARYTILGQGALNPQSFVSNSVFASLFMDPGFAEAYIRELFRLSSRDYLAPFLDSIFPAWSARLSFLQMEFPDYQPRLQGFLDEAQYAHSLLLPYGDHSLAAYASPARGQQQRLQLENRHNLPLVVAGYGIGRQNMDYPLDSILFLPAQMPRQYWLRSRRDSLIRDFSQLRFLYQGALQSQAPPEYYELAASPGARFVFYRVPGIDSLFSTRIINHPPPGSPAGAQALRRRAALNNDGPYRIAGRQLIFPAGLHRPDKDIIIPAGYLAVLEAGATLDLSEGANFVSFSPVQAFGTEDRPIRVVSGNRKGGSFTVLQAGGPSILKNVAFEGLNTLQEGNWELTGAVTFYESDVQFYRCVFRENHCEDGLNIIRSDFELRRCLFSDTPFDAFDSDFCKGTVESCRFERTGNDGMDFSGSVAHVEDCYLEKNGDKGISVGEESDITVINTTIRNANIALASKDLSLLFVRNVELESCQQGFAAYQKKPDFGGSRIIVESYQARDVRRLHAVSEGSRLQLMERVVE